MKQALVINCSAPHYNLGARKLADWLAGQDYATTSAEGDPGLWGLDADLVCLSVIFSWHAPLARQIALRLKEQADVWAGGPGLFALSHWWRQETGLAVVKGLDSRFERQRGHYKMTFGVSGGKDSSAMALATNTYLDEIGHRGPRLLIHSDLGRVEWQASLPLCQSLADRLGLELVVVRRQAGDLLDRWRVRWRHNVERYAEMVCVKLILPWSTARMRFCTSELKTAIICRALVERFSGHTILSVSGIRRQESQQRRHAPIVQAQPRLTNATHRTHGYDWHPLADWTLQEVLAYHQAAHFPLHEAYSVYGSSRVSCAFCILGSQADLMASATCSAHQDIYRALVELEIASTFSFQERQWLGEIAPHLLDEDMRARLHEAKRRAALREAAEARIPRHLWYSKGWPTVLPTRGEAALLAEVRRYVAEIMGLAINYTEPDAILARYAELMAMSAQRPGNATLSLVRPFQEELWREGAV